MRRPEEGHRTPKEGQERTQESTWGSEASEGQVAKFQERRNRPRRRDNGDERRSTFAERRQGAKHFWQCLSRLVPPFILDIIWGAQAIFDVMPGGLVSTRKKSKRKSKLPLILKAKTPSARLELATPRLKAECSKPTELRRSGMPLFALKRFLWYLSQCRSRYFHPHLNSIKLPVARELTVASIFDCRLK